RLLAVRGRSEVRTDSHCAGPSCGPTPAVVGNSGRGSARPEVADQISSSSQRPNTVYEPPSLGVSSSSCAVPESAGTSTTGECSSFSGSGSADAPGATSRTAPRAPPAIAAHRVAVFFIALASLPVEPAAEV